MVADGWVCHVGNNLDLVFGAAGAIGAVGAAMNGEYDYRVRRMHGEDTS